MSSLFRHIMVPLDFTEKNQAAVDVALDLALQNQSRVTLMHVVATIEYADDEEMAKFYESLISKAEANLTLCAKRFRNSGVVLESKVVLGNRGQEIVAYAVRQNVDLVILSSHKVQLEKPKNWATLSHQVAIMSQCPVLLVK